MYFFFFFDCFALTENYTLSPNRAFPVLKKGGKRGYKRVEERRIYRTGKRKKREIKNTKKRKKKKKRRKRKKNEKRRKEKRERRRRKRKRKRKRKKR